MKDASRIAGIVTLIGVVLAPGAALAGFAVAPELDPGLSIAGLVLLAGATALVIERYRRRTN